jgi:GTP pyrophosphokinase
MKGELLRISRQHQAEELPGDKSDEAPLSVPPRPVSKSEQGIIVEGLDNCLVKFSRCCTPVPGDEIVGFITRGYGVPERRAGQEGRWLKVTWGSDTNESYPTTIDVMCKDRYNLLLDISTALSSTNTFVSGLNSRSTEDGYAVIRLEIRVRDGVQMKAIMNKLNQISGVLQVTRPAG